MTSRTSAGLLLYRIVDGRLEVLVGHMGGPFWARKEAGAWTIPKGEPQEGEDPHATAVREFAEEIGIAAPPGPEIALGTVRQRGGKSVMAWARAADLDVSTATSNLFEIEWPPRSGRTASFAELDRVRWVPVARARDLVVSGQVELLDRLVMAVEGSGGGTMGTMVGTRSLGDTGIVVSEVGLGAWQLGRSTHWPDGPDEQEAVRIVHAAIDAGITFLDTAPGYADGRSEANIGAALRGGRRDEVVLCTKFGHQPDGTSDWRSSSIEASVRRSAERMGTDHIDVVVLHSPPSEVLDGSRSDHYEVLERLRQQGLIRAYGASVDRAADVDTVLRTSRSRALEVRLSALYQEPWESVGRAQAQGAGTIVKIPLESGWLAGRYTADTVFTGVRERWSREDVAVRAGLVDEVRGLLPPGVPMLQGALRFLLAHDGVATVIPGVRSVSQLQDVVAAASEPLPTGSVAAIRDWYLRRLEGRPLDW